MKLRPLVKNILRKTGYDLIQYNYRGSPVARRMLLLRHYDIELIFDVGANDGRYGVDMRDNGYKGRIVSFEPLVSAFQALQQRTQNDPKWEARHLALGAAPATAKINVASNSLSSSMLEMLPRHIKLNPDSVYVETEEITVSTLDLLFDTYYGEGDSALLKIDTQGYEKHVLEGASRSLENIIGIQVELSLVPLYRGELTMADMVSYLSELGYTLMSIEPVIGDAETGQLLQVDGLFFKDRRN